MPKGKVIVQIKGGIGNQLFCYATALRLAIKNNAELVVDDFSGYKDDKYGRNYELNSFNIRARSARDDEIYKPFNGFRRPLVKKLNSILPFHQRKYLFEEMLGTDNRLLNFKVHDRVYLDGYWQSEDYFKDVEDQVKKDLKIRNPTDELNNRIKKNILLSNSVAIHIRWFDQPGNKGTSNLAVEYYREAISKIKDLVDNSIFYIFSDNPEEAKNILNIDNDSIYLIDNNKNDASADLWLMSHCKYFIIANSTFSWWGAWLANFNNKIIVCPDLQIQGEGRWGFKGLIPEDWIKL